VTAKNKVVIRIAGVDYTVVGEEPEEYLHKLGLYVDKKMTEIKKKKRKMRTNMAAVLTALNVADDYMKMQENESVLLEELDKLKKEVQAIKDENNNLKIENAELRKANNEYQLKLVKAETELKEVRNSIEKFSLNNYNQIK